MTTKKASRKAASKKASKRPAKKAATGQAATIRRLLAKKVSPERFVERVKAECGGNPTVGYVRWIEKTSR